jgi:hypothetical protein
LKTRREGTSSELFIVRIWTEDLGKGQSEWRGQVLHALSNKSTYFRQWSTLINFLQEVLTELKRDNSPNPSTGAGQEGPLE